MPAPAYRDRARSGWDGTLFGPAGGHTPSISIGRPALAVLGDLMLAIVQRNVAATAFNAPAGWTLLGSDTQGGISRISYYWKIYEAGDPASWAWGIPDDGTATFGGGAIVAISDANYVEQLDVATYQSGGTTLAQSITPLAAPNLIVTFWLSNNSGSPPWSENTGTEQFEYGGDHRLAVNTVSQPTTPSTLSITGTSTSSGILWGAGIVVGFAGAVGKSLDTPSVVRTLAGRSVTTPYVLIASVGSSRSLPYMLRTIVGRSVALNYLTLPIIGKSLAFLYGLRQLAGRSAAFRYGVGQSPPIPGLANVDSYGDGASNPFGAATPTFTDLSVFATLSPLWKAPVETDLWYGRLPFELAQDVFLGKRLAAPGSAGVGAVAESIFRARCSWHGTKLDPERGSFAVVKSDGPLAQLVGERVRISTLSRSRRRSVTVYVVNESSTLLDDISLSRRLYAALDLLPNEFVEVRVEVLA